MAKIDLSDLKSELKGLKLEELFGDWLDRELGLPTGTDEP